MRGGDGEREIRLTATSSSRRVLALEFIRRYFRDFGQSPSYREIGAALGIAPQHVRPILVALEQQGHIGLTPGVARGITLPQPGAQLADSEVLAVLRQRGWVALPMTQSELPLAALLSEIDAAEETVHAPETAAIEDSYPGAC